MVPGEEGEGQDEARRGETSVSLEAIKRKPDRCQIRALWVRKQLGKMKSLFGICDIEQLACLAPSPPKLFFPFGLCKHVHRLRHPHTHSPPTVYMYTPALAHLATFPPLFAGVSVALINSVAKGNLEKKVFISAGT